MPGLQLQTYTGEKITVDQGAIPQFHGQLIRPGNDYYDEARSVWNAMIDRRPGLIVRCESTDDVQQAVKFASDNRLLLAVRGGGHNVSGSSVCDGGLVIDLSRLNSADVDPQSRTVRVGGGATLADVDKATQTHGLAVPGGVVSTTGVGGLTLGGGFGRLGPKYGLMIDNLRSAQIVTADGSLVTASQTENPDLFWAIRGGGGNFGIATSFEFDLHPVGPEILFGPIVYRLEDASVVLRNYRDFLATAPRECGIWADLMTAPPAPFLPEKAHGTKVLFIGAFYAGDIDQGNEVMKPLQSFGRPVADIFGPMPYVDSQKALDDLYCDGWCNYWKSHNLTQLSDAAIDTVVESAHKFPTPNSDILISQVGGAINDVAPDATAYPHRNVEFVIAPGARWQMPEQKPTSIAWICDWYDAMAPHALGGSYVNFITEGSGRERDAFGQNYGRLRQIKKKYDPENLFRLNQNITPAD